MKRLILIASVLAATLSANSRLAFSSPVADWPTAAHGVSAELHRDWSEVWSATAAECFVAPNTVPRQGIYEFPDAAAGGKPYVGQSGNIAQRLEQHLQSGRLPEGTVPRTTEVLGDKTAREIAEHLRIQELTGGVPARLSLDVSNLRDPIGPLRRHLLGDQ